MAQLRWRLVAWTVVLWLIISLWVFTHIDRVRESMDDMEPQPVKRNRRLVQTLTQNAANCNVSSQFVSASLLAVALTRIEELEKQLQECRNQEVDKSRPEGDARQARGVIGYVREPIRKRTTQRHDVCPERYLGSKNGYPFFRTGFVTDECNGMKNLSDLVSVVIIVTRPAVTRQRIDEIAKTFEGIKVSVHVLTAVSELWSMSRPGVTVDILRNPIGNSLQTVISSLQTEFVLVAVNLLNATYIDLRRLIRMYGVYDVVAVGGSTRYAESGRWSYGCYQTSLQNYTLKYNRGYHYSYNECMVCNALESAFLTTRKELLESLDSTMNKDFMEDAFLTWFEQNRKLLSCPDVMFDVSRDEQVRPEEFTKMFGKRELNRWIIDGGQDIWFGCSRGTAHVPHGLHCRKSSGMGLPPCCMESLADSIKFVMSTCEKYNIICELQEGTLLGAVKFQGVLPWERDADITFLSGNYSALKNLSEYFASNGFSLHDSPSYKQWCCADGRIAGGAFRLAAHGWTIELWGQHLMDSELRIMVGEQPSKVFFAGQWVNVPDNPGLYARNRYGHNNLRHAEHWMATGKASGWDTYNSGKFSACANPGHHGCLDQFHADGSLQFG